METIVVYVSAAKQTKFDSVRVWNEGRDTGALSGSNGRGPRQECWRFFKSPGAKFDNATAGNVLDFPTRTKSS